MLTLRMDMAPMNVTNTVITPAMPIAPGAMNAKYSVPIMSAVPTTETRAAP
jgi:hypothetical protein